ncbi:EF-P beta-lysylation protein EpmB [Roseiconus nitratireducens]|uniref:L-lysine 2,3-aminomutase n=2 Tax=Roseiconus nitratireducens TaxID=2605748 RepID=A0A5M6CUM5_9BACT|nr:EF-P beta-lysylation protein EpmB [Roseiconus nitratireducens]
MGGPAPEDTSAEPPTPEHTECSELSWSPVRGESPTEPVPWTVAMKRAIRCGRRLRKLLQLPPDPAADAAESFPTFVPLELLERIRPGDPNDPILRQVLPSADELRQRPGYTSDPVGDLQSDAGGGILHKYHGRALIVTNGACAVHCRYCFRREFPYSEKAAQGDRWSTALDYVRSDRTIEEVLLSGGDPLTLTDRVLADLVSKLEGVEHVRRLRVHTRLPIVIPQRITTELVRRLSDSPLRVWFVVHVNHAREIDAAVEQSLGKLIGAGIPVLNQAVLLAGVNDDATQMEALCRKLINVGVQPYYLHHLDQVRGASHFWVAAQRGRAIVESLRERLPGYAVPEYVFEQAGAKSKTPIA